LKPNATLEFPIPLDGFIQWNLMKFHWMELHFDATERNLSDHVDDLNALGFIWNPEPVYSDSIFRSGSRDEKWQRVYTALQYYKDRYGDIDVPVYFSVPSSEPWPSEIWGMTTGSTVSHIRSNKCFKDHKDDLDSIGFVRSSVTKSIN
jgi:hypothetical protein